MQSNTWYISLYACLGSCSSVLFFAASTPFSGWVLAELVSSAVWVIPSGSWSSELSVASILSIYGLMLEMNSSCWVWESGHIFSRYISTSFIKCINRRVWWLNSTCLDYGFEEFFIWVCFTPFCCCSLFCFHYCIRFCLCILVFWFWIPFFAKFWV